MIEHFEKDYRFILPNVLAMLAFTQLFKYRAVVEITSRSCSGYMREHFLDGEENRKPKTC